MLIRKIVSGGQTGVDRAAIDVAIACGLAYGGWAPHGGRAEDFPRPPGLLAHYPNLRQHPDRSYAPRTRANIRDTAATLILRDTSSPVSPGTALTLRLAVQIARPHLVLDFADPDALERVRLLLTPLQTPLALNVAGPRESVRPGAYALTSSLLMGLRELFVVDSAALDPGV